MAMTNRFPPDMPHDLEETADEAQNATSALRAKAADLTDKTAETVKQGYHRAKDALSEIDPGATAREGGEALVRAVERHPVVAFGLGALSVGLIAWASLRRPEPSWWERYQPDYGSLRQMLSRYGHDAQKGSENALMSGDALLRDYGSQARSYAEDGSRMLAQRARKEPVAALLGVGIAVYVLGSLLTGSSESAPARRRGTKRA